MNEHAHSSHPTNYSPKEPGLAKELTGMALELALEIYIRIREAVHDIADIAKALMQPSYSHIGQQVVEDL